ncbi:MAG TPA: thioredoxin family protein [Candidatus Acidoferrales bacterium]|nr:thioredoxin family protein [Candidatus Acidoferrales bacterium]
MFLNQQSQEEIRKRFADLVNPVKIVNFTQSLQYEYCKETKQILEELAALSGKITLEVYSFVTDKDKVEQYGIKNSPATVTAAPDKDYGIRYHGIPSGYEFASILEDMEMVSTGNHELSDDTIAKLKTINEPVHIQVFVTPTCPYCPSAVITGHRFAYVSDMIKSDMIEAEESPELSMKYDVQGVPRVVVNGTHHFKGAVPEEVYADEVVRAVTEKQGGIPSRSPLEGKTNFVPLI